MLQQKVQTFIQKHQLLSPGQPVIVGVSGGTDSVALLHLLTKLGYDCIIAHCNFHLRMEESNRDEDFVRKLATDMHLPFYNVDFDTIKYADKHSISIEMAARDLRYNWFYELLEKLDAQAIAVAHHADDSIETMLMNLVRGTGLRGLTGIPPRNNKVVRPLLCCTRSEIENYLILHDADHVEDSTNAGLDYQRNKFRNEIIPLLSEINPSVRQTLYESLERFEGTLAIYQQAIDEIGKLIVDKTNGVVSMDINLIKQQVHVPTVMFELLHPYGFTPATISQVAEQLDGESGKVFYSENYKLIKDRNFLIISAKDIYKNEFFTVSQNDSQLEIPFKLTISRQQLTPAFQVSKDRTKIHIDASRLQFPLQIRRWKEGDFFYPFGMKQRKKISDFFIDNKLSLIDKEHAWLLVSGDQIVWVVGMRMDNRFRITEQTTEVIEFKI